MIKAKKSLGQNFLFDNNIIKIITEAVDIYDKHILEIGPGTGNLTSALLKKKPKKFYVIEKDNNLALLLKNKFNNQLDIINKDVLDQDENILSNEKLIVFGNLPYNISTEILCKWILNLRNDKIWFTDLVLMFQKEVADRIVSKYNTSQYGRLTVLANWRLNIKKIIDIKPNSFFPKPKVDSSLLMFSPKKNFISLDNPYNLEKITRIFFNHRRKMIKNPFNQMFSNSSHILEQLNLNLKSRPQNLDLETYYKLTSEFEKLRG